MSNLQIENVLNLVLSFSRLSPSFVDLLLLALLLSPVQLVVIEAPFSQVAVSLVSILGLPFRGIACARLTAAAQATLVAMIDIKSVSRFFPFTHRTDMQFHNAPPCLELPKRKRTKLEKIPELFHNRELLCVLNGFRVIDVDDNRLTPVGRIEAFDRIADPIHGHRFARNGFLLQLLRCKCFIFTNESELIHGHQTISSSVISRAAKRLIDLSKLINSAYGYSPPYGFCNFCNRWALAYQRGVAGSKTPERAT